MDEEEKEVKIRKKIKEDINIENFLMMMAIGS
jgi:hypothetical protein